MMGKHGENMGKLSRTFYDEATRNTGTEHGRNGVMRRGKGTGYFSDNNNRIIGNNRGQSPISSTTFLALGIGCLLPTDILPAAQPNGKSK